MSNPWIVFIILVLIVLAAWLYVESDDMVARIRRRRRMFKYPGPPPRLP
jgi:hypothetical protein